MVDLMSLDPSLASASASFVSLLASASAILVSKSALYLASIVARAFASPAVSASRGSFRIAIILVSNSHAIVSICSSLIARSSLICLSPAKIAQTAVAVRAMTLVSHRS
jgi:hypothetical protein